MKLFDTHAHLGDAKFDAPSEHYGTLREEYLARAFGEDGVGCVLTAGTTVQSSRRELDFAPRTSMSMLRRASIPRSFRPRVRTSLRSLKHSPSCSEATAFACSAR
ncbi:MAG: hypothetical protein ACLTTQ_05755 [Christensenellales bacterium]